MLLAQLNISCPLLYDNVVTTNEENKLSFLLFYKYSSSQKKGSSCVEFVRVFVMKKKK